MLSKATFLHLAISCAIFSIVAPMSVACDSAQSPHAVDPSDAGRTTAAVALPAVQRIFSVAVAPPSELGTTQRARRIAELIVGKSLAGIDLAASYRTQSSSEWWTIAPIPDRPSVFIRFNRRSNDLVVSDHTLEHDVAATLALPELSQDKARRIFDQYIHTVASAAMLGPLDLALNHVKVGWTDYGAGRSDGLVTVPATILDYRFRVYPQLAGLPLLNSLVRVAVHRSGRVASIRLLRSDVSVLSERVSARVFTDSECVSRFKSEFPRAIIKDQVLGYFLPDSPSANVELEPQCAFSFVERVGSGDMAVSRRKHVRYSITSRGAPRTLLGGFSGDSGHSEPK